MLSALIAPFKYMSPAANGTEDEDTLSTYTPPPTTINPMGLTSVIVMYSQDATIKTTHSLSRKVDQSLC